MEINNSAPTKGGQLSQQSTTMTNPAADFLKSREPAIGPHVRAPWSDADPEIIHVHAKLSAMQGHDERSGRRKNSRLQAYERAKRAYSMRDAFDVVDASIDDGALDRLADELAGVIKPILIVHPNPGFHDDDPCEPVRARPTNAIPFAFAQRISEAMGCDMDDAILQIARPGRTALKRFPRFIWQARFIGEISRDHAYIIVDDVCTNGGTLAMLRSHIVGNGGTLVAATTLAHKSGMSQPFPIERDMRDVLSSHYGIGLDALWKKEVGHEIECLTHGEGTGLVEWSEANSPLRNPSLALQRLRNRLAKAKRTAG